MNPTIIRLSSVVAVIFPKRSSFFVFSDKNILIIFFIFNRSKQYFNAVFFPCPCSPSNINGMFNFIEVCIISIFSQNCSVNAISSGTLSFASDFSIYIWVFFDIIAFFPSISNFIKVDLSSS